MATLEHIWDLSTVPLFDMDAPGFNQLARIDRYENEYNKIPGYIPAEVMRKYADCDVEEITWHNCGIAVRFYKGDEDGT